MRRAWRRVRQAQTAPVPHRLNHKGGGAVSCQDCGASGEFLLTAGTALAIEISRRLSVEEVELLAAFFSVLGDQLALLALKMPQDAEDQIAP